MAVLPERMIIDFLHDFFVSSNARIHYSSCLEITTDLALCYALVEPKLPFRGVLHGLSLAGVRHARDK